MRTRYLNTSSIFSGSLAVWAVLLASTAITNGCIWQGDLDLSDTTISTQYPDQTNDSDTTDTQPPSSGVFTTSHVSTELTSTIGAVVYPSSTVPTGYSTIIPVDQNNNLFKYGQHTLKVLINHIEPLYDVRLSIDDGPEMVVTPTSMFPQVASFAVDTTQLVEGPHRFNITIFRVSGAPVELAVDFQVVLNATDIDVAAGRLLMVTTLDAGLLIYDLGDDPLNPSDDKALGIPMPESIHHPTSYDKDFSLLTPEFLRLSQDDAGRYWIGTAWGGVLLYDDNKTPFDPKDDQWIRFSLPPCGAYYVCGEDRVNPTPDTLEGLLGKVLANTVTDIVPVGTEGAYVATLSGLHYLKLSGDPFFGKPFITSFSSKGRYDANIAAMKRDTAGRLWLASFDITGEGATDDALTVFDPGPSPSDQQDDQWAKVALFPFDAPEYVYSLTIDHHGLKWLGTDQGLFTLNDGNTPFDPSDDVWVLREQDAGLADPDVGAVVVREDGTLLVGGFDICSGNGGGLAVLQLDGANPEQIDELLQNDPEEWVHAAMDPTNDVPIHIYTTDDGLVDPDVSSIVPIVDNIFAVSTFNILKAWILDVVLEAYGINAGSCEEPPPGALGVDGITILDFGASLSTKADDRVLNL